MIRQSLRFHCTLIFILAAFNSCVTRSEMPHWFDSIQRMPIKTVSVQGHQIAYLDEGQGDPIILVHGFSGSMWHWEYQQGALSRSHRLITLDLLGSGLSDKPAQGYTPIQFVEFFKGFMDALEVDRASLVGNSMGAGLVIGMALTYPKRVDHVVLIGGFPDHVRDNLTSRIMKRAIDSWAPVWLVELGNRLAGREATRAFLSEFVHDAGLLTPAVIERSYRNRQIPGIIAPLKAMAENLPLWENGFAKRFSEINHPTLILWGTEDKVFPTAVGEHIHQAIARSSFKLINGAGHLTQWERPDLVNPAILGFIEAGNKSWQ